MMAPSFKDFNTSMNFLGEDELGMKAWSYWLSIEDGEFKLYIIQNKKHIAPFLYVN